MIRNVPAGGRAVLDSNLPAGSRAWIDRDWLSTEAPHLVPALVQGPDGALRFGERELGHGDAARTLTDLAARAAAPVAELPPGSVEVVGNGAVAGAVRALVGAPSTAAEERPAGVVVLADATEAIVAATERVRDAGIVVLAAERLGQPIEINLYRDIHRRGLRVIGVPGPGAADAAATQELPPPARAEAGTPLADAPWYLLEA